MSRSHAKVLLKSAPQKLNFVMAKLYQKVLHQIVATNPFARSHKVTHSQVALFLIKTILCETSNILFSRNYQKLGKMNARF